MSVEALLRLLGSRLDAAGIPFMLTGSVAAAFHGAGRATMDIDVVIAATSTQLASLVESLEGPGIYVSADAAREALRQESMFNVVSTETGWKADLIIRKDRPFSRAEFDRRQAFEFEGTHLWVATVEDLVLAKLEWAKLGASARQIEDAAALVRVAADTLDRQYLDRWIPALGVEAQWRNITEAGEHDA